MDGSYGAAEQLGSTVVRVLAPNPSPMTHRGTCTYVLGEGAGRAVIDPGPPDAAHMEAVLGACSGARVEAILVTHAHLDHSPGAALLAARTGAPVLGWRFDRGRSETMQALAGIGGGEGVDRAFAPDREPADGERIEGDGWAVRAHWTPGHMASHLSFETPDGDVLSGDVAMGWASTMISPPDGDVAQFLGSMDRLAALGARRFLPGHGEPVEAPAERCRDLRAHRLAREAAILAALDGGTTIPDLVARVYVDTPPALHPAAARNVLAHLIRLAETGAATADRLAPDGRFRRA
ncbi:MBL fold metallo-hydrolase [Jannaschia sp. W003]|uniref:MBL fold metallo-hydrolase n=1 Tax=Jannaschia sp. W003 TaxID=2867012 RepID=UPI0021A462D1|nr:MBL fold metallo-hydrolase [Jannaschia sp. W003]UWQ20431.1 MBL fold metallo-hydrolase [Jannaschia sp. W003]